MPEQVSAVMAGLRVDMTGNKQGGEQTGILALLPVFSVCLNSRMLCTVELCSAKVHILEVDVCTADAIRLVHLLPKVMLIESMEGWMSPLRSHVGMNSVSLSNDFGHLWAQ